MSIGSRGDMEPFLALGQEMQTNGHQVGFCFPAQFEELANTVSPDFYPQDRAFLELIEGPEIRKIMGQVGSGLSRIRTVIGLLSQTKAIQERLIVDQEKAVRAFQPDEVVFHIKCIYPVFLALRFQGQVRLLSPMPCLVHATQNHPHVAFGKPRGSWWNRMTYHIAELALIRQSILGYGKRFILERGLRLTSNELKGFFRNELQVEYAYDDALFPKPSDWPDRAKVSRFRHRNSSNTVGLDERLESFLSKHKRVVYVGFGSMVNAQPKEIASDVIRVCERLGIGVVLNRSWGGLEPPEVRPTHVHVVDDVPFEILFPKMDAIVHHGGSGTTQLAARSGKPQAIIPHIADQFFWSRRVVACRKGVAAFPIKAWSEQRFESTLLELLNFTP